jgi:hypothetical protein
MKTKEVEYRGVALDLRQRTGSREDAGHQARPFPAIHPEHVTIQLSQRGDLDAVLSGQVTSDALGAHVPIMTGGSDLCGAWPRTRLLLGFPGQSAAMTAIF